jgi:glycine/D-amino acid oxidase-like deaminating enzyme
MRLRHGSSYWLTRSDGRAPRAYPQHRGEIDADVAIVGGGFTGCAAAYVLARAGVRVALFERTRLGRGSAAANTALLMQEPDRYFAELVRRYDVETARTVWRLSRRAVRDLIRTLRDMDCGLRVVPSLHLARDAKGARELRRDYHARHKAGLGGRLLDAGALHRRTGLVGTAAILTTGNAVVDPYRATHALARAAARAGALICERSEVVRVTDRGDGAVITTARGRAHCRWAVIATGFATPAFKPLQASFTMASTYVIATRPVPKASRAQLGDGELMFWDAARPYHYFRWTDDGRILFGGGDRPVPRTESARHRALVANTTRLHQALLDLFPRAGSLPVATAWEGLFATTPDGLPYIGDHPRYPRQLFALGYGGNGMTFGFLAARILLRRCLGRSRPEDALFSFARARK